jgi:anthranilate/para-aminobenzoate synthase component I
LGEGFGGEPLAFSRPRTCFAAKFDDLRRHSPFAALRAMETKRRPGETIAGFLSYECVLAIEPDLDLPPPPIDMPAAFFGLFEKAVPLPAAALQPPESLTKPQSIDQGMPREDYAAMAEDVRQRILRGDVFQVNVSHRQSAVWDKLGPDLLGRLPWQEALQSRFGALVDLGDTALVSASPELFLEAEGRNLAAEPIKGTRPRSKDPAHDQRLAEELLADPKDRAENMMIADLMRNDLAKVCDDYSISEPVLCGLRSYPSVHHLYSRIEGRLRGGLGFADALTAAFPCGSVTGAPKRAAIEAIAALEGEGRGPYCGTVFMIGEGRAVASVAIRTAVIDKQRGRIDVRSGGGVTALSDPFAEYDEAIAKAYLFRHLTGQT